MKSFVLPPAIADLVSARNKQRTHYNALLKAQGSNAELKFTLDGNLVGDLGEAIAVELFGIQLLETKSTEGIDGYAPDGCTTVQVKATGTKRGPAFRHTETRADHLLFFELDLEKGVGEVVFNGPELYAVEFLPREFNGQRMLTRKQIRAADQHVMPEERLRRID